MPPPPDYSVRRLLTELDWIEGKTFVFECVALTSALASTLLTATRPPIKLKTMIAMSWFALFAHRCRCASLEAWLDSLPKKERIYFRKKLKSADDVRIEYRTSIEGLEEQIASLFNSTLAHSKVDYGDFDKLHPDYFTRVVDGLGEQMTMMLCWKGRQLLSFQLCLIGRDCIINKQLGMRYPEGREHNLFFVNWLLLVRYAIEKRIGMIEMGATTYAAKLLFGGHLEQNPI